MRALSRLPEPQVLISNGNNWLASFLASGKKRPDSSKYAHKEIRIQLATMSFSKCFYCETKLKDQLKEVDHHIEVSVNSNLSFAWTNLYLSCDNCNNKVDHNTIPIADALDPCVNSDTEIEQHLKFVEEQITAENSSLLGFRTITKYRLDSEVLDKKRINQLKNFYKLLSEIYKERADEGGRPLNQKEIDAINYFKQIDQPFSLLFKKLIDKTGI